MCGISAIVHKRASSEGLAPVGRELVDMLDSLAHRGIDSSGVTICGEEFPADYIIRLWCEGEAGRRGSDGTGGGYRLGAWRLGGSQRHN